jgi:hypothetical protein
LDASRIGSLLQDLAPDKRHSPQRLPTVPTKTTLRKLTHPYGGHPLLEFDSIVRSMPFGFCEKCMANEESKPISAGFGICGWFSGCLALTFALELAYQQAILTRQEEGVAVGYFLVHDYTALFFFVIAILSLHGWLISFVIMAWRRRHGARIPVRSWIQFAALAFVAILFYVPQSFWEFATLEIVGPGPEAHNQLVSAAYLDELYLVKALMNHGIPGAAAVLDGARRSRRIEMARYLISRGAKLEDALACRTLPEFSSQFIHLPDASITVTAP